MARAAVRDLINDWQGWSRDERLAALIIAAALMGAAIPAAIELTISAIPGMP